MAEMVSVCHRVNQTVCEHIILLCADVHRNYVIINSEIDFSRRVHFANCIFLRLGEVSDYTLATFLFIVCAALYYLFSAILSGKIQDWGVLLYNDSATLVYRSGR